MKATIKIASAILLMVSSAAFAAGQTTAPAPTNVHPGRDVDRTDGGDQGRPKGQE